MKKLMKAGAATALVALIIIPVIRMLAQPVPQPGLLISITGSNQFQITITNGVTWANYEIYRTPFLADPVYPWSPYSIGSLGQTNFSTNMGVATMGYFRAAVGLDWDADGVPNTRDPQPSNASISNMVITIDSPAANASVP